MADVTVKLTIGSFSVEVTGDQGYVDKKFEELVTRFLSSRRLVSSETATPASVQLEAGGKKTSAAEFLKKSLTKNQSDRALALGYFLEKVEGVSAFTSSDIDRKSTRLNSSHS